MMVRRAVLAAALLAVMGGRPVTMPAATPIRLMLVPTQPRLPQNRQQRRRKRPRT